MDSISFMFKARIEELKSEVKELKIKEKEEKNFIKKLAIKGKIKKLEDKIKSYYQTSRYIENEEF